ncbi:MAG: hypothetical protein RJA22_2814 [Verrucomicrobiota bacterium]
MCWGIDHPPPITVARWAMATRFEIALYGADAVSLRAAAEEALGEIERLEAQLSLFRPSSEIGRINARGAQEPVRVSPPVFRLLEQAARLSAESGGAFDITIGPLMRCWGFRGGPAQRPDAGALAEVRSRVGMQWVECNPADFTVRLLRGGVTLDLGAIGKGYAVGVAAEVLREAGVTSALLHGGTSTVLAIGHPPGAEAWPVAVARPAAPGVEATGELLAVVPLRDEALSVSAAWGRSVQAGGEWLGHVLDPRTGQPTRGAGLAMVALPDAMETDALSTALLVLGAEGLPWLARCRPAARALVGLDDGGELRVERLGLPG